MKKRRNKNLFSHPIFFTLIGLALLFLIAVPLVKNINKKKAVDKEIKELEEEISRLETDNNDLQNFISHLNSEEFIEEQARLNLGMKKRGEEVVILKNENIDLFSKKLENNKNNDKEELSNPQRWWRYFFQ